MKTFKEFMKEGGFVKRVGEPIGLKDFAKAAKASEDIFPAKNVSTILNSV